MGGSNGAAEVIDSGAACQCRHKDDAKKDETDDPRNPLVVAPVLPRHLIWRIFREMHDSPR